MTESELEPLIASGRLVLALARMLEDQGDLEAARKMYVRAINQGLLVRRLKQGRAISSKL